MKLITNYSDWVKEAYDIVSKNKGIVRASTFNMYVKQESETEFLIESLPKNTRFVVGVNYSECYEGCPHCQLANQKRSDRFKIYQKKYGIKVTDKHHMKYFSRGDKAIVGGFNISDSCFTDFAVVVEGIKVKEMNKNFDRVYNAAKSDSFYTPIIKEPLFPFGKYRGHRVSDIVKSDPNYIRWIINTFDPERLEQLGLIL